jgi:hypothetical protein
LLDWSRCARPDVTASPPLTLRGGCKRLKQTRVCATIWFDSLARRRTTWGPSVERNAGGPDRHLGVHSQ